MKIGSRIPIATGSYQTGATTAITSSLVNTQFQYQDVGVQIEMTPTVHFDHDVTLKLKIEDTSESGTVDHQRRHRTDHRPEDLRADHPPPRRRSQHPRRHPRQAGLVSISGIPGLGELPLLKYIFGSKSHEVIDDEVVFVLIPHVVRGQDLSPAQPAPHRHRLRPDHRAAPHQ
jgi:general secretion pathway protein D